jgi:hypothetical protein
MGIGLASSLLVLGGTVAAAETSPGATDKPGAGVTSGPAAGTPATSGTSSPAAASTPHQQGTEKGTMKEGGAPSASPTGVPGSRVGDMPATPHQKETVAPDTGKPKQ